MTLDDDQVAVDPGPLHGHYHRYRANTQSQILVFQNNDKNVPEPEFQDLYGVMQSGIPIPDFQCVMSFGYKHPGSPEVTLRLGYDKNGDQKVSWRGNTPTGWWSANPLQDMGRLPSGIDAANPIFSIQFNYKGEETPETGTVYGLVLETSHVYRAIGSVDKKGQVRLYDDNDIGICTKWHIVMVSKEKPSFV